MDFIKAKEEYKTHNNLVRERRTALQAELNESNELIRRAQERIDAIKKEFASPYLQYQQLHTHLLPLLAKEIADRLGMQFEFYGPSGIRRYMNMYFYRDNPADPEFSLVVLPPKIGTDQILYETGEQTNEFEVGRVPFAEEKNKVLAPLPDTIEEIITILRTK